MVRARSLTTPPSLPTTVSTGRLGYLRSGLSLPSLLLGSSSSPKIASLALSNSPLSSSRSLWGSLTSSPPSGESPSLLGETPPPGTSPVTAPSLGEDTLSALGGASSSLLGRVPSSIPDVLGGGASSIPSRPRDGSVLGDTSGSTRPAPPPKPGSVGPTSMSARPSPLPMVLPSSEHQQQGLR